MDTIFALSSGRGKAGVAVIRISGADARNALYSLGLSPLPASRKAVFSKLVAEGKLIDHALVLWFDGPNSFTGEDTAELQVHGSMAVVERILSVLGSMKGFRLAYPGEFSKRAFENGKMDLVQAEGLADLIEAETAAQSRQALRAMEGEASKIYENWRGRVIEIMAFIEAYIDFPDEDIPHNLDLEAQEKVIKISCEMTAQLNDRSGERIRNGVIATIIGEPNVGKSTLINFLAKRELAIVSDIAGTTRDSLEAHLNIDGLPLTVIDTAGIRESADKIEQEGVRRALEKADKADFSIVMLEAGVLHAADHKIKKYINEGDNLIVINKTDLAQNKARFAGTDDERIVKISLKEKSGTDELLAKIKKKVETLLGSSENAVITRERHKRNLEKCSQELQAFVAARQNNIPIELCGENLRRAAYHLGNITGRIGVEDVLDKIFSEFCIGK